jgi:hypothetical protein
MSGQVTRLRVLTSSQALEPVTWDSRQDSNPSSGKGGACQATLGLCHCCRDYPAHSILPYQTLLQRWDPKHSTAGFFQSLTGLDGQKRAIRIG